MNLLRPDLALLLGDFIMGYSDDPALVGREWDAFAEAIGGFRVPVRLVPGNHEVFSAASAEAYRRRWGPPHYAFLHRGCRFVVLDSEDVAHRDRIAGEQLEWLRGELRRGGARRTFVFLHKPFWRMEEARRSWMADVHPLLREAGVEAVFAGHIHSYEKGTERDGVRYYISGGAGAEIYGNPYAGDFFHHLLVEVPEDAGEPVRVHVLRTGFLQPDTAVTEAQRDEAAALTQALRPRELRVREDGRGDAEVKLSVANPGGALLVRHELDRAASGAWTMAPDPSSILVPAGGGEIWLQFHGRKDEPLPGPVLSVEATRGAATVVRSRERVPVRFERSLEVPLAEGPLRVDGLLDEPAWTAAPSAGRFLRTDGEAFAALPTDLRAVRDAEAIYLSFRCEQPGADALQGKGAARDWVGLSEDCVVFYLDPVHDGSSRFCFGATALGVPMDYRAPGGVVDAAWDPGWERAVRRDAQGWTLEARVPFALLGMDGGGWSRVGLNAFRFSSAGEGELTGWSLPAEGRLSNPAGFGSAVPR